MTHLIKNILAVLTSGEKKRLSGYVVSDVLISLLDIAFLAVLLFTVNFYTQSNSKDQPFSNILLNTSPTLVIGSFLVLFSIKNLMGFFINRKQYRFIYDVAARISTGNLWNYLKSDYLNYSNTDSSVHIRTISQQPIEFGHYVLRGFLQIISQLVLIAITIAAILAFNATVFIMLFLVLMPGVFLLAGSVKKKLGEVRKNTKRNSINTIQYLQEALGGFIESNIYNRHNFFINRYSSCQQKFNRYLADQQMIQGMSSRMIEIFAVCGLFILIVIDTYSSDSVFSMITIGSFMVAAYKVIPGIVKIMNAMGQIKTYEYTVRGFMPENNTQEPELNNTKKPEKISSIEFNEVSFKYDHGRGVYKFSLSLGEGDLIGISGTSGRGKTTVINLLLGFLKPDSGNIYINNNTTASAGAFYRNQISYIKQQSFFIHDTLLKNITLDDAGHDNKKLNEVIRLTGLELLISTFSDGLNYLITENGKNLSGGQRQRIMVARALYHDFDLLIMDEPFSQLDEFAEDDLLNQLKMIAQKGKIIILITHNKNSLSYCNKVISLDAA